MNPREQPHKLQPGEVVSCLIFSVLQRKHVILLISRWQRLPLLLLVVHYKLSFYLCMVSWKLSFLRSIPKVLLGQDTNCSLAVPKTLDFCSMFPCWSKTAQFCVFQNTLHRPVTAFRTDFSVEGMFINPYSLFRVFVCFLGFWQVIQIRPHTLENQE